MADYEQTELPAEEADALAAEGKARVLRRFWTDGQLVAICEVAASAPAPKAKSKAKSQPKVESDDGEEG